MSLTSYLDAASAAFIEEFRRGLTSVRDLSGQFNHEAKALKASGGYSSVYVTQWEPPDENPILVCYKELRPPASNAPLQVNLTRKTIRHLTREVKILQMLSHPHIIEFIGYAIEGERCDMKAVLISRWCSNGDIVDYLRRHPDSNRVALIRDMADGLQYLHNQVPTIIHGDIKPHNVLISDHGNAQLCDFGLSRVINELTIADQTTSTALGYTARYSAPEVIIEEVKTAKSDVYAFGCTCIHILFSQTPYPTLRNDLQVLTAIGSGKSPWNWDTGVPLESLLSTCCHPEQEARPSIDAVLSEIHLVHAPVRLAFATASANDGVPMEAPHEVSWESPLAVPDMTVPRQGSLKPGATGGKDDSFAKTTNGHNQTKERVPVFGGSHIAAPDPGALVAATPMITTSSKANCVENVSSSLLVHKEPSINNGRDGFTGIAQDAPTGSSKLKRKGRSRGETHTENWAVTPRVLVVEDDLVARRLSSKFLQVSGCTIDVAEDGLKAVDKMNSKKYDLVLMDIMMPRMDGISATTLIRKFDQMTPIISMTTNSKPAEVETYYSNGMNDILPKPFTLDAMIDILDKHLNHLKRLKDLGECHNSLFKDDEAIVQEGIPTALGSIPSILLTPSFSDSYPTAEGLVSLSTFTDSTSHGPSSSASSAGYRIKDPSKIKLLKELELEPESQRYPRIPLKSLRTSSKTTPKPPDIASPGLFSEGPDAEVTGTTVGGTTLPIFSSSKKREREEERGKGVKRIRFKIVDEETGAPPDQLVILELPDLGH